MKKFKIAESVLLDGRFIDPNNTGKIDSVSLTRAIIQFFPSSKSTGMGLLDLEDENYKSIRKEVGSKVPFNLALEEFIKMVRIAKNLRPMVQWSVYNVPYVTYYEKNDDWRNQENFLMPLLEMVDILTPSLYDFYPADVDWADDKAYYTDNIQMALKLGKEFNKPVMPYIWHRWHDSNAKVGMQLIDESEFDQDLNWITRTSYENTFVSGLIWFDAQTYFYHIKPELKELDHLKVGGRQNQTTSKVLEQYAKRIAVISGD